MVFVSSTAVRNTNFGLGPYAVSKAALERLVRAWRTEQPDTRYVCMVVGETEGTAFARDFDMERAAGLLPAWVSSSSVYKNSMQAADLGTAIAELIAMLLAHPGLTVPEITIVPPGPMMTMDEVQKVMDGLAAVLSDQ
jgi:NAD(P)-dependent dehydrogenase (short-subunit alcohol dehydrogenase family)